LTSTEPDVRDVRFTVIGGNGFIGSRVAAHLQQRGAAVRCPDRDELLEGQALGHVLYCAGLTADYAKRPFDTVEAHVSAFAQVVRACEYESIVYLSSTRLYDGDRVGRETGGFLANPQNPRHLYDLSKALGEWLCIHTTGGRGRVARLASVYSGDLASDNFLHHLIEIALHRRSEIVDTTPDASRDYVDVEDVCALLVAMAVRGRRPIYNIASGENVTNAELFEVLLASTGCQLTAAKEPSDGVSPVIDISAIVDDFAFSPRTVQARIPQIIAQHREGSR
jgi:UDP-glucose 4-epimerase